MVIVCISINTAQSQEDEKECIAVTYSLTQVVSAVPLFPELNSFIDRYSSNL